MIETLLSISETKDYDCWLRRHNKTKYYSRDGIAQTYTPVDIELRDIVANTVVVEAGNSDFYKSE